jgi:hypothetical protein
MPRPSGLAYYTQIDEAETLADFQTHRAYTRAQQEYERKFNAAKDEAQLENELELFLSRANDEELLRFLGIKRAQVVGYIIQLRRATSMEENARRKGDNSLTTL